MAATIQRKRFSVDDYEKMVISGILDEDERIELIDGEVRCMSPIGSFHYSVVNLLNRHLVPMVGDAGIVSIQNPIQLDDYTQPQPDIAIFRWREDYYHYAKPTPRDILLVIEVSDSSLNYDRNEKLPRYAQAEIPEVWIVDLDEDRKVIEQYSSPVDGRYAEQKTLATSESIISVSLPSVIRLNISDVFR